MLKLISSIRRVRQNAKVIIPSSRPAGVRCGITHYSPIGRYSSTQPALASEMPAAHPAPISEAITDSTSILTRVPTGLDAANLVAAPLDREQEITTKLANVRKLRARTKARVSAHAKTHQLKSSKSKLSASISNSFIESRQRTAQDLVTSLCRALPLHAQKQALLRIVCDAAKVEMSRLDWQSIPSKSRPAFQTIAEHCSRPDTVRGVGRALFSCEIDAPSPTTVKTVAFDDADPLLRVTLYTLAYARIAYATACPTRLRPDQRLPESSALPSLHAGGVTNPISGDNVGINAPFSLLLSTGLTWDEANDVWAKFLLEAESAAQFMRQLVDRHGSFPLQTIDPSDARLKWASYDPTMDLSRLETAEGSKVQAALNLTRRLNESTTEIVSTNLLPQIMQALVPIETSAFTKHLAQLRLVAYIGDAESFEEQLRLIAASQQNEVRRFAAEAMMKIFKAMPSDHDIMSGLFVESTVFQSLLRIIIEDATGADVAGGAALRRFLRSGGGPRLASGDASHWAEDMRSLKHVIDAILRDKSCRGIVLHPSTLEQLGAPRVDRPDTGGASTTPHSSDAVSEHYRLFRHSVWVLRRTFGDHSYRGTSLAEKHEAEGLHAGKTSYAKAKQEALVLASDKTVEHVVQDEMDSILGEGGDDVRYAAAVVGGNNYTQIVDGSRRLLSMLTLTLDAKARFEFRQIVEELESYRLKSSELVLPALGLPSMPPPEPPLQIDSAGMTIRKALKICREVGTNSKSVELQTAVAALRDMLAPWRYVDPTENEFPQKLLQRSQELVPSRHRAAIYPLLAKFFGSIRVSDVDTGLLGLSKCSSQDSKHRTQHASDTGGWAAVLSKLHKRLPSEHGLPQQAAVVTKQDCLSYARKLATMLNTKDFGRIQKSLAQYYKLTGKVQAALQRLQHGSSSDLDAIAQAITVATAASSKKIAKKLAEVDRTAAVQMLNAALQDRFGVMMRMATTIFGPLAFALDAPFRELVRNRMLTPELLSRARHIALLQDAQLAIAEELLLDDEQHVPGVDSYDDVLYHLDGSNVPVMEDTPTDPTPIVSDKTLSRITNVNNSIENVLLPMLEQVTAAKRREVESHDLPRPSLQSSKAVDSGPNGLPHLIGPWGHDEYIRDRWSQVGVETSVKLFEESASDDDHHDTESSEVLPAAPAALDDVLVSVKKQPPPSRAYFQQAILAPMRLSVANSQGKRDRAPPGPLFAGGVRKNIINGSSQVVYQQGVDTMTETSASLVEDFHTWNTPEKLAKKIFISKLPFDTTEADVFKVMQHVGGDIDRMELWYERAQYFERQLEAQESAAECRARWQDAHRKPAPAPLLESDQALPQATNATKKRFYKVLDDRRRKYAAHSPLCAFVYFKTEESFHQACTEYMRLFGVVLRNQACRIEPALDRRVLHISNVPRGMTSEALALSVNSIINDAGFSAKLTDKGRLRHGVVSNGDALLEFSNHVDALWAALLLRGTELTATNQLVVGWAHADEWRQAKPRLPVYF